MIFLTKKGKHYSNQFVYKALNILNRERFLEYSVLFNDTCRYELPKEDQEDINKLFGFSLGFNHHQDSARFGWFYKNDKIHLYSYIYDEGKRSYEFITNLDLNKKYSLTLIEYQGSWEFGVSREGAISVIKKIDKKKSFCMGYRLWPYFGGNNPAPHDIEIYLQDAMNS